MEMSMSIMRSIVCKALSIIFDWSLLMVMVVVVMAKLFLIYEKRKREKIKNMLPNTFSIFDICVSLCELTLDLTHHRCHLSSNFEWKPYSGSKSDNNSNENGNNRWIFFFLLFFSHTFNAQSIVHVESVLYVRVVMMWRIHNTKFTTHSQWQSYILEYISKLTMRMATMSICHFIWKIK